MTADGRVTALGDAPRRYGVEPPYGPPERLPEFAGRVDLGPTDPNPVYIAVRDLLLLAGLDAARAGTGAWNPLGEFIRPGNRVVLKPNWVRHFNPEPTGTMESVVTHPAVIRAMCDYALLAAGPEGRVIIADAPQHDCDLGVLRRVAGVDALEQHYRGLVLPVEFRDLRQEAVIFEDGVVTQRFALSGDPEGYSEIDLGRASAFVDAPIDPKRLRGADYDVEETIRHHSGGVHRYLVANTILRADCVINLPKIKTHKKAGLTCCLKNLVGINGNKNYLPHHTRGFPGRGGDEFDRLDLHTWSRWVAVEWARKRLMAGKKITLIKAARRMRALELPPQTVRSGNWHGNDTIWRTVVDLNTILQYADGDGNLQPARFAPRRLFHLAEGIVVGGGDGPLNPTDVPAGLLLCSTDPVRLDAAAAALMGFDWRKIHSVREAARPRVRPLTESMHFDRAFITLQQDRVQREFSLASCPVQVAVPPHFGWRGHIERAGQAEEVYEASFAG
jgi:uncharacterized protein (DUF362 family)